MTSQNDHSGSPQRQVSGIIRGQRISSAKRERSKEFRKTMTPAEAVLWKRLRGNRLHGLHFRRQQVIDGFIVDFYCHAHAFVLEVDGPVHNNQREYDAWREAILREKGLKILRVTNDEVMRDIDGVLERVHRCCMT